MYARLSVKIVNRNGESQTVSCAPEMFFVNADYAVSAVRTVCNKAVDQLAGDTSALDEVVDHWDSLLRRKTDIKCIGLHKSPLLFLFSL